MEELAEDVDHLNLFTSPRRTGRMKRPIVEPPPTPPAKRKSKPSNLTEDKVKKFYMNKTSAKFARQALETIYEDPLSTKSGATLLVGTTKIKRQIIMQTCATTKQKKMCRKKKLKRLGMKWVKLQRLSDDEFKRRLMLLDSSHSQTKPQIEETSSSTDNKPSESMDVDVAEV